MHFPQTIYVLRELRGNISNKQFSDKYVVVVILFLYLNPHFIVQKGNVLPK